MAHGQSNDGQRHHQLAILQEKLYRLIGEERKYQKSFHAQKRIAIQAQIKSVKAQIDQLGKRGSLKMALVVVRTFRIVEVSLMPDSSHEPGTTSSTKTYTYFFHDLDDESIYQLLKAYLRNGQSYLSQNLIEVPLGKPLDASLENSILSWQISS